MIETISLIDEVAKERVYLKAITEELSVMLSGDIVLVVKYAAQELPSVPGKKIILLNLSDEGHAVAPEVLNPQILYIFQHYMMLDRWGYILESPNVETFPLGPTSDFLTHVKPMSERKYDYSFSGQCDENMGTRNYFRYITSNMVGDVKWPFLDDYNGFINFTEGFGMGLNSKEYSELMADTKVSLCPGGAASMETFRFFESMAVGSVVITPVLPKTWYYEALQDCFVTLKSWYALPWIIKAYMEMEPLRLQGLSEYIVKRYDEVLSPKAVAEFMYAKIHYRYNNMNEKIPTEVINTVNTGQIYQ